MFDFTTAGESHGKGLVAVVEGVPAGLALTEEDILPDLRRRQMGYGRGGRMRIERDRAEILSGVRGGSTLGSPIALLIENRDWENWKQAMDAREKPRGPKARRVTAPRPGHADLAGYLKFGHRDLRNVLERASARETAARVAVGAVARRFLAEMGVRVCSEVLSIGGAGLPRSSWESRDPARNASRIEASEVRCADPKASRAMIDAIKAAQRARDTVGGVFVVVADGLPAGLGSYTRWDARLDTRLAAALMSIPAIKGVEVGMGFGAADTRGSKVHDPIRAKRGGGFLRLSNHAGGLEGGTTNGERLVVRAAMKPIATLSRPLESVDLATGRRADAAVERSDTCAVPAAAVVGEAMVAIELARSFREKFGGDSMQEVLAAFAGYRRLLAKRGAVRAA
ncbi:MAG TPA: chorismate synthase [bacterium]|nr:chorismate synthase [bacterium]